MDFPQQFGKYTLLRRLATGGMAEIFLARQVGVGGFEKEVVVKRLLPLHAANQDFVSMFLDEARIAAHLTHPNISQIFDLGQEGEDYYIAMEYVHGADLRRVCSQGIAEGNYLPLHHAVRIICEVCDALAYAHTRTDKEGRALDIVHRDISPTNILVTYDGGVKLVDFGIAKATNKVSVTKTGQIKGKYGYMSPEQCRGDALDGRSDIFAVGINLYEITLGRRLFRGDSDVETIRAIESGAIPAPRSISPDYPERLERIVLKALARDPDQRYHLARELQMALEDFLADSALRSTAGMLTEYMRQLFRDQLELEVREGSGLRMLPQVVSSAPVAAASTDAFETNGDEDILDQTVGDAPPDMPGPGDSGEVLTSARSVEQPEAAPPRTDAQELRPDAVVDGRKLQIARLPTELRRPAASSPPALPPQLSAEPSVDDLMIPMATPSIELTLEESGITGPLADMWPRNRQETPLVALPVAQPKAPPIPGAAAPKSLPPALQTPSIVQGGGAPAPAKSLPPKPVSEPKSTPTSPVAPAAPPIPKQQFATLTSADEAELRKAPRHKYLTGLLFLLLVVAILFGIQYLFVEDGARMQSRRTPNSVAAAMPPGQMVLGGAPSNGPDAPVSTAPKLGIVRVESDPPGARVVVNGNVLNAATPASVQTFAEMQSTVRVLMGGYLPFETRLVVPQAGTDVKAVLQKGKPDLAKLHVESSPVGATIWINGNPVGVTPLTMDKVGAGVELTLRLEMKGYYDHGVLFTLQKDESRELGINLLPDTGKKDVAVVNVESIPEGATVFDTLVEGGKKPVGKTGNYPLKLTRMLDAGLRLRAEMAGLAPVERDLDVKLPYYTVYMRLAVPEATFATLSMLGAPGITVYLGTQELGITPFKKVKVSAGDQTLVMLDATSGKRSELPLHLDKDQVAEKTVVLKDGTPALQ